MIDTFADQSSLYDSRCARLLGRLCALVDDTYKSNPSLCRIAIVTAIVPQLQLQAAHFFSQAFHLYQ